MDYLREAEKLEKQKRQNFANQLTVFYMKATLAMNGLRKRIKLIAVNGICSITFNV